MRTFNVSTVAIIIIRSIICLIAAALFACSVDVISVRAQNLVTEPAPPQRLGLFGHYTRSQHVADFTGIQGIPTCCDERYGTTWTTAPLFTAGALAEMPIVSWLNAAVRLDYTTMNATLQATSQAVVEGGTTVSNIHLLSTRLSSAGVELMLAARPLRQLSVYAGLRAGLLTQSRYDYKETLASKGFVYKGDSTATRNAQPDQALPTVQVFQPSLLAGLSYEFPMNREGTLMLTPEVFYSFGLSNIVSEFVGGGSWRVHQLRGGLSVRWSPTRTTPIGVEELQEQYRDTLLIAERRAKLADSLAAEAKKRQFSAQITSVTGVFADGKRVVSPTIRLTTMPLVVSTPLLPTVFFAEHSAVLPSRYKRILAGERGDFPLARVAAQKPVEQYFHILNVVGKRWTERANKSSQMVLTLTGCALSTELNANDLARRRAEAVREYLQNSWRIPANELRIESRVIAGSQQFLANQSSRPSAQRDLSFCVEIRSAVSELFAPLSNNTKKIQAEPSVVEYGLEMSAGAGLKQWNFEISQLSNREAHTIISKSGNSPVSLFQWFVDSLPPVSAGTAEAKLDLADVSNNEVDAPIMSVPVVMETSATVVHQYIVLNVNDEAAVNAVRAAIPPAALFVVYSADAAAGRALLAKLTATNSIATGRVAETPPIAPRGEAAQSGTATTVMLPEERLYSQALTVEIRAKE